MGAPFYVDAANSKTSACLLGCVPFSSEDHVLGFLEIKCKAIIFNPLCKDIGQSFDFLMDFFQVISADDDVYEE